MALCSCQGLSSSSFDAHSSTAESRLPHNSGSCSVQHQAEIPTSLRRGFIAVLQATSILTSACHPPCPDPSHPIWCSRTPMDNQEIRDSVTVKPDPSLNGHAGSPQSSHNGHDGANTTSPIAEQRASKIAACLSCRRSKVRCEKGADPVRCRRCAQTGGDCIRPTFNVGRRKGVKK